MAKQALVCLSLIASVLTGGSCGQAGAQEGFNPLFGWEVDPTSTAPNYDTGEMNADEGMAK